jgi:hypothetical protein
LRKRSSTSLEEKCMLKVLFFEAELIETAKRRFFVLETANAVKFKIVSI